MQATRLRSGASPRRHAPRRGALLAALLAATVLAGALVLSTERSTRSTPRLPASAGAVHFVKVTNTAFDRYASSTDPADRAWITHNMWRMIVFSPYWDDKTGWYPRGWVYRDAYAIYRDGVEARAHPDWILRDARGNRLYIPYECSGGTCPQYAADIGDPAFRAAWIAGVKADVAKGYRGVFVDDVNLDFAVGDGNGSHVTPRDPRTGATMTWARWRGYMVDLLTELRAAIPGYEIVHNSVWYAGDHRLADPYVRRQIAQADYLNIERGINDHGVSGGSGPFSLTALLGYVDRVHALGKSVILDSVAHSQREHLYELAGYFLISTGRDGIGSGDQDPDHWWSAGYGVKLGAPKGDRYRWHGVLRRDFAKGLVLLNEPGAPRQTLALGGPMHPPGGHRSSDTVVLGGDSGAVLLNG